MNWTDYTFEMVGYSLSAVAVVFLAMLIWLGLAVLLRRFFWREW